jgi:hypothetical protein
MTDQTWEVAQSYKSSSFNHNFVFSGVSVVSIYVTAKSRYIKYVQKPTPEHYS